MKQHSSMFKNMPLKINTAVPENTSKDNSISKEHHYIYLTGTQSFVSFAIPVVGIVLGCIFSAKEQNTAATPAFLLAIGGFIAEAIIVGVIFST